MIEWSCKDDYVTIVKFNKYMVYKQEIQYFSRMMLSAKDNKKTTLLTLLQSTLRQDNI